MTSDHHVIWADGLAMAQLRPHLPENDWAARLSKGSTQAARAAIASTFLPLCSGCGEHSAPHISSPNVTEEMQYPPLMLLEMPDLGTPGGSSRIDRVVIISILDLYLTCCDLHIVFGGGSNPLSRQLLSINRFQNNNG